MHEGELAFEREILISGCLCDCSICRERRMQRLAFSSQVFKLQRQKRRTDHHLTHSSINHRMSLTEVCLTVFKAHLAKISRHFAS